LPDIRLPKGGGSVEDWEITAHVMIGALHTRYVSIIDNKVPEELPKLFTENGILQSKITGKASKGDEIASYLSAVLATRVEDAWVNIRHFITPPHVELIDRSHGSAECYFAAFNAKSVDHWGIYTDEVEQQGDAWLFATRSITLLGATPDGWVGTGSARLSG
jgi:hypothetical protein